MLTIHSLMLSLSIYISLSTYLTISISLPHTHKHIHIHNALFSTLHTTLDTQNSALNTQHSPSIGQAFSVALPHGRGVLVPKASTAAGAGKGKGSEKEGAGKEDADRPVRGMLVGVTVQNAENATVADLRKILRAFFCVFGALSSHALEG